MQIVCTVHLEAEEYAAENAHFNMERPPSCPHCSNSKSLRALGYYARSITSKHSSRILAISIRRFRCIRCRKTISILPAFAQPYRLICNTTIERFFRGQIQAIDALRWNSLLKSYKRRFDFWLPRLITLVGNNAGLSPPSLIRGGSWQALMENFGDLPQATVRLVRQHRATIFGQYRCHQSNPPQTTIL